MTNEMQIQRLLIIYPKIFEVVLVKTMDPCKCGRLSCGKQKLIVVLCNN